jgi:methylmalonyl-CoA mutase N-terminal domain/subunit
VHHAQRSEGAVEDPAPIALLASPAASPAQGEQVERLKRFKANRDQDLVQRRLEEPHEAARGSGNLLRRIEEALRDRASMGEVCEAMADVFGRYTLAF